MRAIVIYYKTRLRDKIALGVVFLGVAWVMLAFCFQLFMMGLEATGQDQIIKQITDWFYIKFDGNCKENPANIWYEEPKKVHVSSVTNRVVVGSLAGNRNLEFGVRNVIEEVLQDKDYELDTTATLKLTADIVYLDVVKTQSSFSVLHKDKESVVIRLKGQLVQDGKVKKKATVEESADEISMSTLVVDQGGKFNQQNLSSALKKASESLINKLID